MAREHFIKKARKIHLALGEVAPYFISCACDDIEERGNFFSEDVVDVNCGNCKRTKVYKERI